MIINLPFIQPNKDKYLLDQVNCIEKPLSIVAESKRSQFSNYYIMLMKCFSAYRIKSLTRGSGDPQEIYENTTEVMNLLGLRVNHYPVSKNMHAIIREQISQQKPVLVFGNLRMLYYSHHYRTSDWNHLFLIKGYNDDTDVYAIMDSAQKKDEGYKFEEFVITSEQIDNLAASAHERFNNACFFSIEHTAHEPVEFELLIACIKEIIEAPLLNNEIVQMEFHQKSSDIDRKKNEDIGTQLLWLIKSKEVLYKELIQQLRKLLQHDALIQNMEETAARLIQEWKAVIPLYLRSMLRKNMTFDVRSSSLKALESEKRLKAILTEILSILNAYQESHSDQKSSTRWFEENNEEGIITIENETIQFNYVSETEYHYTNCPKVMLPKNTLAAQRSFVYKVDISILNTPHVNAYQAGIVFRTSYGETFIWGIFSNEKVVLSKAVDPIFSVNMADVKRLQIRLEPNGEYVFSYGVHEDAVIDVFRTSALFTISEIGVGGRNWYSVESLKLAFKPEIEVNASVEVNA